MSYTRNPWADTYWPTGDDIYQIGKLQCPQGMMVGNVNGQQQCVPITNPWANQNPGIVPPGFQPQQSIMDQIGPFLILGGAALVAILIASR